MTAGVDHHQEPADMYGLPRHIDLNFLNLRTLLQACFGLHDLILNFDDYVSITVTSAIGCARSGGEIQRYDNFSKAAPNILELLNRHVVSVAGDDDGTLKLEFDDGSKLLVFDDSEEYESYTIKNGDQLIVV